MENTESDTFSRHLSALMESRGMVQADLAVSLGVSQAAVSRWLGGRVPRAGELYRLAKLFGVSMESLLGAEPDVEPTQEELDTVPVGDVLANRLRAFARQMGWSSVDDLERFLRASQRLAEALRPASGAYPVSEPGTVYAVRSVSAEDPAAAASSAEAPPGSVAARARARREATVRAGVDALGAGIVAAAAPLVRRAKSAPPAPSPRPSDAARAGSGSEPAAANPECPPPSDP